MLKVFFVYISSDKFSESRVKTSEQSEKDNDQKKGKYQLSCVSGCFPFIPHLEQLLPMYLCPAIVLSVADINVDVSDDNSVVYKWCKGHPSAGEVANNVAHIWCRHDTQICHINPHLKTNGSCGKFVPNISIDGRFLLLSVTSYIHETISVSWWRRGIENMSAILAFLHWKPLVTEGFFWQRASNSEVYGFLSSEHFLPSY